MRWRFGDSVPATWNACVVGFLAGVLLTSCIATIDLRQVSAQSAPHVAAKETAAMSVAIPEDRSTQLAALGGNITNSQITLGRMKERLKESACRASVLQTLELEAANDLNAYNALYQQTRAELLTKDQLSWQITADQKRFLPPAPPASKP